VGSGRWNGLEESWEQSGTWMERGREEEWSKRDILRYWKKMSRQAGLIITVICGMFSTQEPNNYDVTGLHPILQISIQSLNGRGLCVLRGLLCLSHSTGSMTEPSGAEKEGSSSCG
jgi:hypothetical protein